MLKQRFTSHPILAHFDAPSPSTIKTDASDHAKVAIYSQTKKNGRVNPVAFLFQRFSPADMNYDIHDKEIMAIVLAY